MNNVKLHPIAGLEGERLMIECLSTIGPQEALVVGQQLTEWAKSQLGDAAGSEMTPEDMPYWMKPSAERLGRKP